MARLVNSAQISHQTTRVQSEKTIRWLEIILRTIMIKKRQGLFHNSANNRERWSRKAIAWRSVSCKMISSRIRQKKHFKLSVCILYLACGLQSAFCTRSAICSLHFVLTGFCWSEPQVRTEILELEKKIQSDHLGRYNWCVDCILKSSRGKA